MSKNAQIHACFQASIGLALQGLGAGPLVQAKLVFGPWRSRAALVSRARSSPDAHALFSAFGVEVPHRHSDWHADFVFHRRVFAAVGRKAPFAQWRPGFATEFCAQLGRALAPQQAARVALAALLGAPNQEPSAPELIARVLGEEAFAQCCQALRPFLTDKARLRGSGMSNATVAAGSNAYAKPAWQEPPGHIPRDAPGEWALTPLLAELKELGVDTAPLATAFLAQAHASMAQVFRAAFAGQPLAWRCALDNDHHALLGFSAWGIDPDLPGPDGQRPIDIAVKTGRALLFRSLIAIGADAVTKAKGARKSPIERGQRLLRDDLAGAVLAEAEKSQLQGALASPPPAEEQAPPPPKPRSHRL